MRLWLTKYPDSPSAFQPNVHPAVQSQWQSSAATESSKKFNLSRSVSQFFTDHTLRHFRLLSLPLPSTAATEPKIDRCATKQINTNAEVRTARRRSLRCRSRQARNQPIRS